MEEILHLLRCIKHINPENHRINYQPQLVNAGFLNHQQYDWKTKKGQCHTPRSLTTARFPPKKTP